MNDIFRVNGYVDPSLLKVVTKGWGLERWLVNGKPYCCKELFVCKGKRCSYHYHRLKDETFLVVEGEVVMTYSAGLLPVPPPTKQEIDEDWQTAKMIVLRPGDVFHVPPFMRHSFYGAMHSRIIEASTEHFDEDSIRLIKGD